LAIILFVLLDLQLLIKTFLACWLWAQD
jgi:hypothetical protein